MLPKVQTAEQIVALDLLLTQLEKSNGYEVGRIGIEAQIENALGLINVDAIAQASPRVETIIFGPSRRHDPHHRLHRARRLTGGEWSAWNNSRADILPTKHLVSMEGRTSRGPCVALTWPFHAGGVGPFLTSLGGSGRV